MNLCFINTRVKWAGGEKWFLWAASAMVQRGHKVVIAARNGSELENRALKSGITVKGISAGTPMFLQLRTVFRETGCGTVVCNTGREARSAVVARSRGKLPKIVLRRGLCRDIGSGFIKSFLYSRLDGFIFNSQATAGIMERSHPWLTGRKSSVMYNPVPPCPDHSGPDMEQVKEQFGIRSGEVVAAAVGRLDRDKGHEFLLRAFKKVLRSEPSVRLVVAGEGPEEKALRDLADRLDMRDKVVFCGFLKDPFPLYHLADILVMPSLPGYESFSNAALEAMSCSVPVVATNVGGFSEMIADGENGFLIPSCNIEEMARVLERLVRDEDLRLRMGVSAREKVVRDLDPADKAKELEEWLDKITGQEPVKEAVPEAKAPESYGEPAGRCPVSCCVVTFNEEDNIKDCLESISWADEIVVVDSFSTDATRQIASEYTDRVLEHQFDGHVEQKNYAIDQASHEWILSIDADERVTPELKQEMLDVLHSTGNVSAYSVPRLASYLGRFIRHSGWYPDRKLRLFRRDRARWGGRNPHDHIETSGETADLKGNLLHYTYRDISDHLRRINSYTSIAARGMASEGRKATFADIVFRGPSKFLKMYVLKAGFLDGYPGFVLAVISAYYVFLKYCKLREIESYPDVRG